MDKNNNTLSEVRKTAAQRMWDAENKQRAKSDASNKRTPSSIPVPAKSAPSQGVAEGFNFNDKKGRWEWDDGTSHNASNLTPAQKAKVQQWKAANPSKHQGKATPDTRGEHTPHGTGAGPRVMEQSVAEAKDPREYDYEGDMAKSQLRSIIANAQRAHDMLEDDTNMAEWVQSKIL